MGGNWARVFGQDVPCDLGSRHYRGTPAVLAWAIDERWLKIEAGFGHIPREGHLGFVCSGRCLFMPLFNI